VTRDTDEELVRRCLDGDRGAFRLLVARYQRPLYNAAYRVLGNAADASDVTQATFMEAAEHLDGFDPDQRFFSWIYRIAVNAARNVARRSRRETALGDAGRTEVDPDDPQSRLEGAERARRLQEALMRMSEDHRTVLTLRHFSDLSYRDIALVLDLDEKTVKSRLFEARQRLRALLSGGEGE
jgi:RNA polymerase sigma-70 factor (ECF subfamily)